MQSKIFLFEGDGLHCNVVFMIPAMFCFYFSSSIYLFVIFIYLFIYLNGNRELVLMDDLSVAYQGT